MVKEAEEVNVTGALFEVITKQIDTLLKNSQRHRHIMINLNPDEYEMVCRGAALAGYHRAKFARAACLLGTSAYLNTKPPKKTKQAKQAKQAEQAEPETAVEE